MKKTVTLAVLDDGDFTTWSSDALIIEVPKEDYDADVFDNGKECAKYFDKGVSGAAAVDCVQRIMGIVHPHGLAPAPEHSRIADILNACGFWPERNDAE